MSTLLRLCTAGSVDDGKSTLIGRLLYEARAVYEDQLSSVKAASRNRGAGPIDFSLFTDGLKAEREQGITIDVAYRYFATARRKFILADTPGHEQYTRNMATGASTADLAILLVDARHGVREQTRRHARIAQLLGISHLVLAVNKMDLVGFDRGVFDSIARASPISVDGAELHAIPLSALNGDNVVERSAETPWFTGAPLLEYLETVTIDKAVTGQPFRFPVQLVVRPNHEFRGYAGQIASGTIRPGDRDHWCRRRGARRRVKRIVTWDGDLDRRSAPMSVTLTLEDEVDVSRGDVLVDDAAADRRGGSKRTWCGWTSGRSIRRRVYLLKHAARTVTAELDSTLELERHRAGDRHRVAAAGVRSVRSEPHHRQLHRDRSGDQRDRRRRHDRSRAGRGVRRRRRVSLPPSGSPCARADGAVGPGGRRRGAPAARGDPDMIETPSVIARELDAGGAALRHVELSGRVRRAGAHAAAAPAGAAGAVPRHGASLRRHLRLPRRDRAALEPESDQPAGRGALGGTVAAGHAGVLRPPQGGAAVPRAAGL